MRNSNDALDVQQEDHTKQAMHALALAALGIVFGDIGTSPVYAMKESFEAHYGLVMNEATIL